MPRLVGDFVVSTAVLTDLRKKFPDAEITAMVPQNIASLLEHDPDVNEVFTFSRPSGWEKKDESRDIVQKLRAGRYDLGVLLTHSVSSVFWFWRGRVKNRVGYAKDYRRFLLNKSVPWPKDQKQKHVIEMYKGVLKPLGIPLSDSPPRLYLTNEEMEKAEERLAKQGVPSKRKLIGVNPGSAGGAARRWMPERFQEVVQRLLEDPDVYVVFFGDAAGAPLVKSICSGLPDRVINLAGATSLRELAVMIKLCDVLLTNDSGPMHLASAVETPLVALFGSTSDLTNGPYGGGTVIHKHVECSPCHLKECPIDFRCMTRISTDEVYNQVVHWLDQKK